MGISKQWSRTKVQPFVYHLLRFSLQKSPRKGHSKSTKPLDNAHNFSAFNIVTMNDVQGSTQAYDKKAWLWY